MDRIAKDKLYFRAQKRVNKLRGFYTHLAIYLLINIAISLYKFNKYYSRGESISDSILNLDTLIIWFAWGIGILLHAFSVFWLPLILGRNWEEKKIEKYMEEEHLNQ